MRPLVVEREGCTRCALTEQKLLLTLGRNGLTPYERTIDAHGHDQIVHLVLRPHVAILIIEPLRLEVWVLGIDRLLENVSRLVCRLDLEFPATSFCLTLLLQNLSHVDLDFGLVVPDADLGLHRVVLDKGVSPHELHCTVALVRMVFSWVTLPHTDGRVALQDDAVQSCEGKEVHHCAMPFCLPLR